MEISIPLASQPDKIRRFQAGFLSRLKTIL